VDYQTIDLGVRITALERIFARPGAERPVKAQSKPFEERVKDGPNALNN
jgi:hypothetical protein